VRTGTKATAFVPATDRLVHYHTERERANLQILPENLGSDAKLIVDITLKGRLSIRQTVSVHRLGSGTFFGRNGTRLRERDDRKRCL